MSLYTSEKEGTFKAYFGVMFHSEAFLPGSLREPEARKTWSNNMESRD
jgi:hypothetical protein